MLLTDLDRINQALIADASDSEARDFHGRWTSGGASGKDTSKMTRGEAVAHLRANGYTGPVSYNMEKLRGIAAQHGSGARTAPAAAPAQSTSDSGAKRILDGNEESDRKVANNLYDRTNDELKKVGNIKVKGGMSSMYPSRNGPGKLVSVSHEIGYNQDVSASVRYRLHMVGNVPTATPDVRATYTDHEYVPGGFGGSQYQGDAARAVVAMDSRMRSSLASTGFHVEGNPVSLRDVQDNAR